jgi:hypothetical protein
MSIATISRKLATAGIKHVVIALASDDTTWDDDLKLLSSNIKLYTPTGPKPALLRVFVDKYPRLGAREFAAKASDVKRIMTVIRTDWNTLFEIYFEKTHGRKPRMEDYRISGIGDDKLSEDQKNKLRGLAHKESDLSRLYVVFTALSKKRNLGDGFDKACQEVAKLMGYKNACPSIMEFDATPNGSDSIRITVDKSKREIEWLVKENGFIVIHGGIMATQMKPEVIQKSLVRLAEIIKELKTKRMQYKKSTGRK